jgi:hypothetical protein
MRSFGKALVLAGAAFLVMAAFPERMPVDGADGRGPSRIVIPKNASAAAVYAAGELQKFLQAATGTAWPVVDEDNAEKGPAFFLGPTRRAAGAGLVARAAKLGPNGVLIKTLGRDVILLGRDDRGQLYSVYEFLERYLGCRFLARDCTVTPKRTGLALPDIDFSYGPPFIYREALYHDAADWPFAARQRLNGANMAQVLGRPWGAAKTPVQGILIFPFAHSAAYMVPPSRYFAEHPEYFGLVGGKRVSEVISGQLCYTNPDVQRISTAETLKLFEEHPEITSVDISQNDSWPDRSGACECQACAAVVKAEGAQHGPILRLVNAIADSVAEKYPGKFVDTLAYSYTVATPKVTKPRDNVIIRLCHYACYFHGIEGETLGAEFRQAVDDWRRVARNVFIWHYGTNFWSYLAPNPNLTALAKDVEYYHTHGINGMMLQGDIQSSGGELAELRQYLVSQLMWDPARDPQTIRKDFCAGYYGPAANDVLKFLATMDRFAATTRQHIPMNGWRPQDVTPPEFVSNGLAILNRAYDKASDDTLRNRIDKLLLPLWYMQLSWPDRYGLARSEGPRLLARVKSVLRVNDITTISEGPPDADEFIKRMEAAYK